MVTSYNGWPASPDLATRPLVVAGESFVPGVLDDDDVWTVLNYVATQLHERVEPIVRDDWHQMDDWGYSYRRTTGATSLSNHSSGTAIDYNATRHPFNVSPLRNFTQAQINEIHQIVNIECEGLVEWGGDYRNTPDAMHFDIKGNRTQIAALANKIRNMGKDWFDMATREELREVVDNAINNPDFIKKVAKNVTDEVWRREFNATNANDVAVKKPAREFLKESWEGVKKLGK